MTDFNQCNFTVINNVISNDVCDLLSNYINFKANLKSNIKTHDALSGVHREYGDPLMESILTKLTPIVEKATGMELWPTLSFYYRYLKGCQLTPHKDRSSCQIVVSLCIAADDDFKNTEKGWPLVFKKNGIDHPVTLNYGDAIVFKGYETEHWREKFTGQWFVCAVFGYVDKNGPFCFQKYDQRKQLGKPHIGMLRWLLGCFLNRLFGNKKS